jgi:hypothetical protein
LASGGANIQLRRKWVRKFVLLWSNAFFPFALNLNRTPHTVSPNCSRKSFFAKLGGLLAAAWVVPSFFAKSGSGAAAAPSPVSLRPEQRAVSRKEGSY